MPTAPPVRALLVEDEPHARRYLRELLTAEEHIVIVGEASNGVEGADLIRALSPELVFLDIQMPEAGGFDLIARTTSTEMNGPRPAFIFVTAFDEYAVRAFEVEAVDYLCKPFGRERLSAAVERAYRHLRGGAAEAVAEAPWLARITVKEEERITFVPVDDLLWIEAANKYVVLHTSSQTHVARQTIQTLSRQLDPARFVRIHRSILVRKSAVRGLQPLFHGDYVLRLTDGTELTLSRTFRDAFFDAMSR
jgi:two-component system LytT family response regulator